MESHEKGCTANPDRVCGICAYSGAEQRAIAELTGAYLVGGFKELQGICDSCPACTLAGMRQADMSKLSHDEQQVIYQTQGDWDVRKAFDEFWSEERHAREEAQSYNPLY